MNISLVAFMCVFVGAYLVSGAAINDVDKQDMVNAIKDAIKESVGKHKTEDALKMDGDGSKVSEIPAGVNKEAIEDAIMGVIERGKERKDNEVKGVTSYHRGSDENIDEEDLAHDELFEDMVGKIAEDIKKKLGDSKMQKNDPFYFHIGWLKGIRKLKKLKAGCEKEHISCKIPHDLVKGNEL